MDVWGGAGDIQTYKYVLLLYLYSDLMSLLTFPTRQLTGYILHSQRGIILSPKPKPLRQATPAISFTGEVC